MDTVTVSVAARPQASFFSYDNHRHPTQRVSVLSLYSRGVRERQERSGPTEEQHKKSTCPLLVRIHIYSTTVPGTRYAINIERALLVYEVNIYGCVHRYTVSTRQQDGMWHVTRHACEKYVWHDMYMYDTAVLVSYLSYTVDLYRRARIIHPYTINTTEYVHTRDSSTGYNKTGYGSSIG